MALSETTVRERLAFIRYLLNQGIEQSYRTEPHCALAILTFHDATELFFGLSCEHLGVTGSREKTYFNQYWDLIAGGLNGTRLTQETSIRRLNDARIALKHHGIRPAKLDSESFRAVVVNFFEENTQLIFHIKFSELSLIDLVQFDVARNHLKQAQGFLKQNKIDCALEEVAVAFAKLIQDYERRKLGMGDISPFFPLGDEVPLYSSEMKFEQLNAGPEFKERMGDFVNRTNDSISFMQRIVRILSLGMDYRKYAKFERLTPLVDLPSGEAPDITWANIVKPDKIPGEDAQFCIDFVIESAIKLQDYDYNLKMLYP
jgi:hypothetical protein